MTKRKTETKRQKMSRIWGEARGIYHKRTVRPGKARPGIIWYETSIDGRFSQSRRAS